MDYQLAHVHRVDFLSGQSHDHADFLYTPKGCAAYTCVAVIVVKARITNDNPAISVLFLFDIAIMTIRSD